MLSSFLNFFSSASPRVQTKKDTVNISQSYKWLMPLLFKKIYLSFIHKNTDVWRSKFSPNKARDLLLNVFIKFKKKLFLRTNLANLTRSLVGVFDKGYSSNLSLMLKSPLCVVYLSINWPHLQLLERNLGGRLSFFSSYQWNSQCLECMTNHFCIKGCK